MAATEPEGLVPVSAWHVFFLTCFMTAATGCDAGEQQHAAQEQPACAAELVAVTAAVAFSTALAPCLSS